MCSTLQHVSLLICILLNFIWILLPSTNFSTCSANNVPLPTSSPPQLLFSSSPHLLFSSPSHCYLRIHRQDPNGYGLLYVDASQKANLGSSCSHSCNSNCTSAVVARNGRLVIVLTTVTVNHPLMMLLLTSTLYVTLRLDFMGSIPFPYHP